MNTSSIHAAFETHLKKLVESSKSGVSRNALASVLTRVMVAAPSEIARADIAKGDMLGRPTQLNPGVVSKAVYALVEEGFLTEDELRPDNDKRYGRPIKRLTLGSDRFGVMGIKVVHANGRPTELAGVIMKLRLGPEDALVEEQLVLPEGVTFSSIAHHIRDFAADLMARLKKVDGPLPNGPREILCAGVEVAGHVHDGHLIGATHVGLPPEEDFDLMTPLHELLGVPVVIDNDVNVLGVRELYRTTYKERDLALVAVFNDGVGATLIIDGHVYRGGHGMAAEPGHQRISPMEPEWSSSQDAQPDLEGSQDADRRKRFGDVCDCGKLNHIDCFAVPDRLQSEVDKDMPFAQIASTAALGNNGELTRAGRAFRIGGNALGQGIATIINVMNPSRVVVLLPSALAPGDLSNGSAAAEYVKAMESAVTEYSFSRGADVARAGQERLTIDAMEPASVNTTGARCAAIRALDSFIAHARGRDECKANDPDAALDSAA